MKVSSAVTSILIAVVMTIAVFVLAWKIVLPNYFSHKNNLISLEDEVSAAKAKLESIDKVKVDIAAAKSTADQIMVSVPKGKDEPDLISELEAIGIKNSIVIPTIDISEETATASSQPETVSQSVVAPATVSQETTDQIEGTGTTAAVVATPGTPFTISFTVQGSFEQLNGFIVGLENSVRFMNIKSLTYETSTESKDFSLALEIEAYQR